MLFFRLVGKDKVKLKMVLLSILFSLPTSLLVFRGNVNFVTVFSLLNWISPSSFWLENKPIRDRPL